mgnify:FL=1
MAQIDQNGEGLLNPTVNIETDHLSFTKYLYLRKASQR